MEKTIRVVEVNGFPHWEDTDGFRVPVLAGGDENGNGVETQVQGMLEQNQNGDGQASTDQGDTPGSGQGGGNPYSLADNFLQGVPDEHRPILEPYVKKWDAGVTRRFQEIHSQYEPYKQLGEPDQLSQAVEIYQLLDQNPQLVYQILHQQFGQAPGQGVGNQQIEDEEEEENPFSQFQEVLTPFQQQMQQQQQMLEALAQVVVGKAQQERQAEEDRQLDQYLTNLKQEFGEFDEKFVLSQMANGMSGEDAVKAFYDTVQQFAQKQQAPLQGLPKVLSGGGAPPPEGNVSKLGDKDVRSLVANLVKQANQE